MSLASAHRLILIGVERELDGAEVYAMAGQTESAIESIRRALNGVRVVREAVGFTDKRPVVRPWEPPRVRIVQVRR